MNSKLNRIALPLLASTLLFAVGYQPAFAQDTATKPTAKDDLKKAGSETKDATKKTGHAIAKGTKTAATKTKDGTETAGKDTAHVTKKAAVKTKDGAETVGRDTKNGTKKVVHKAANGTANTADKVKDKTSPN
jgi:hypothetical protein